MDQTVISSLFGIGLLGTILHSKFQARQSKDDIEDLKDEIKDIRKAHTENITNIYQKIDIYVRDVGIKIDRSNDNVITKIDEMKVHFVATRTCDITHRR
jgi:hypothetical protein